ncbi:MAG: hypothetical protein F4Z95_02905 [Gammaproteobacteria bacterium]|nr:hypothetical protein [Gammaproteobacteria bacterium]
MDVSILIDFADELKTKFSLPGSAAPEDQLKAPVAELLKRAGADIGLQIDTRTESTLSDLKARPDIAIHVAGLICGYIELKAPGSGADAPKLKGKHNKNQWKKLKSLPNLIYTDGCEWAHYRNGERQGLIVRLDGDPTTDGKYAISEENADRLGTILQDFLNWEPRVPDKAELLAQYLAPLTRLLRSDIETALKDSESASSLLATQWRKFFFPDADNS